MPVPQSNIRPNHWLPIGYSIVGVQKAATTSLSDMLERHPQVALAPFKEFQFFNADELDWQEPDYRDYKASRRARREVIAGDATPVYLFWPHALERMHAYNPDMRLIAVFRDPVERLFSQWSMQRWRHQGRSLDWPELIRQFRFRDLPSELPAKASRLVYAARSGVLRGLYGQQLERGFLTYDPSSWLLLEFRGLLADHRLALDQVTDHLGLQRFRRHPELPRLTQSPPSVPGTRPTPQDVEGLVELYADDLELFSRLSGLDIGHWPTVRILQGSLSAKDVAEKMAAKVASDR